MGQPATRKLGAIQAPPRERLDLTRFEVLAPASLSVVSKDVAASAPRHQNATHRFIVRWGTA
jgi:hypothetical protein